MHSVNRAPKQLAADQSEQNVWESIIMPLCEPTPSNTNVTLPNQIEASRFSYSKVVLCKYSSRGLG